MNNFKLYLAHCKEWVEKGLCRYIEARPSTDPVLARAMRYSLFNGGKRIRPLLVHAASILGEGCPDKALPAACAIECIHAYSLIHDDLPAMDNDDMRRGKPSCHRQFGEAVAILAGDALQSLAFEMLATTSMLDPEKKIQQIATLAKAAGCQGMASGQSLDMAMTGNLSSVTRDVLETMHSGKTGALICASLIMGAQAVNASDHTRQALSTYGRAIGLAFQVRDDILDRTSTSYKLGKPEGSDDEQKKATYVTVLGLEQASQYLDALLKTANQALAPFNDEARYLKWIANYIVNRDH